MTKRKSIFERKNNSVIQMVDALKRLGPMTENEITKAAFAYDRNYDGTVMGESNKKYADMLRRGLNKGLIDRVEAYAGWNGGYRSKARFVYYATRSPKVECSAELDNAMYNESI